MQPGILQSIEDAEGFRCVDIFARADGSFGFREYRRDPEDSGGWSLVADYSGLSYATAEGAVRAAAAAIPWLGALRK